MPWEVTIRRADSGPLGASDAVRQLIGANVPGVQFRRQWSGAEQIAAARAAGVEFPEFLRRAIEERPASEQAEVEEDGFSVVLYGFEADPLLALHAEVRGDGNPVPVLAAVCRPRGWVAVEDATGRAIELAGTAAGWESFRAYRERAVRTIAAADRSAGAEPGAAADRGLISDS